MVKTGELTETLSSVYVGHSFARKLITVIWFMNQLDNRTYKCLSVYTKPSITHLLNAFRSSPKESLHVQANEQPLHIRRIKLSLQYAAKLYTNKTYPAHNTVFNPKFRQDFLASEIKNTCFWNSHSQTY